jgi:hypothetical protein
VPHGFVLGACLRGDRVVQPVALLVHLRQLRQRVAQQRLGGFAEPPHQRHLPTALQA